MRTIKPSGRPLVIAIGGPTASGKSALAMHLAELLTVEIVNFDSMQVYRGMDIGTAKPGGSERTAVPHHLLDIRDPDEEFSVGQFIPLFRTAVDEITARGAVPVAVGGTGLYLRGALGGLFEGPARDEELRNRFREQEKADPGRLYRLLAEKDPETAERTMPNDLVRVVRALEVLELTGSSISRLRSGHAFGDRPFDARVYCLSPDREQLYRWVEERVDAMMASGLLEEVRGLREKGYGRELASMKALGYRELMAHHLDGETNLEEAVELIKRNTRRYAKRQLTWFRGEEGVTWLEYAGREEIPGLAERIAREVQSVECRA
ncbi:MAG: tRNA (adenosine(37)-N6)-dimethylallyltransferase MiaA [bacterium]|nr:tRNA (adenosine(37)-N6)-dimethylallyltransferase MiaA [bacterium]MDT8396686.1 tRNA (adenosine(37)-N6)-dimethylallyltransferase MiaA [bacterium]